jgi:hypothetical protein
MSEQWASSLVDFSSDAQRRNVQAVFTGSGAFFYAYGIGSSAISSPKYAPSTSTALTLGKGTQGGRTGLFSGKVHGAIYAAATGTEATNLLGWLHGKCGLSM